MVFSSVYLNHIGSKYPSYTLKYISNILAFPGWFVFILVTQSPYHIGVF